jgi:DNA-binding response OmpR family regulator
MQFFRRGAGALVSDFKSREVLLVEDEWLVRMELADAFETSGFRVIESASADYAAEVVHANPGLALLITDIRLAGPMNGWDLATEARMANPIIPVIYLSANPPASERIVAGGVFIDKPALTETVMAIAMRLLDPSL